MLCAATLCFATLDTIVKFLSAHYPIPLLIWVRWSVQAFALAIWLAPQEGAAFVRTKQPGRNLLRGAMLIGSSVCFVFALREMPLASVTALNYTAPMLVVVMAALVLHERLTPARIAFVVAGAVGMLLIVRPGTDVFRGASLLALASAALYAVFQVMTRRMAREDPGVLMFYPALVGVLSLSAVMPFVDLGVSMPWTHMALLVGGAMIGTLGHFLLVLAFRRGSASGLTPYTYVHLVWATLIGWAAFGTFPDALTFAGMAIIAASGLAIAVVELRMAQAASPAPGTVTGD